MSLRMRVGLATSAAIAAALVPTGIVIFATYNGQLEAGADDNLKLFLTVFVLASAAAIVGGLGLGWLAARMASARMARLTDQLSALGGGGESSPRAAQGGGGSEMAELSRALNSSLERIRATSSNLEAALAGQRGFLGQAARGLRTPLLSVATSLHVLRRRPDLAEGERTAALDRSLDDVASMRRFVDGLDLLARLDSSESLTPTTFEWRPLIESAVEAARVVCAPRVIVFGVAGDAARGRGDVDAINELLAVLFDNIAAHTPATTQVTVGVAPAATGGGQELTVADDGPGVPASQRDGIFEPFAGRSGDGAGLGLAIARAIARAHGGTIVAETNDRRGLRIRISFPPHDGVSAKRLEDDEGGARRRPEGDRSAHV